MAISQGTQEPKALGERGTVSDISELEAERALMLEVVVEIAKVNPVCMNSNGKPECFYCGNGRDDDQWQESFETFQHHKECTHRKAWVALRLPT